MRHIPLHFMPGEIGCTNYACTQWRRRQRVRALLQKVRRSDDRELAGVIGDMCTELEQGEHVKEIEVAFLTALYDSFKSE